MQSLGSRGEDLAEKFLKKKGYRIITRNYKNPIGEIDIIAEDKGTVVFVEVKTRKDTSFGYPFESVDRKKQEKLRKVALFYLKQLKKEPPSRFDVLSIETDEGRETIEHITDAFE